jgi:hypothetical protein
MGMGMTRLNNCLKHACGLGSAAFGILLISVTSSSALVCAAPAPLIGVTGPYGVAAAAVAYGGYLVYKKLKNRG